MMFAFETRAEIDLNSVILKLPPSVRNELSKRVHLRWADLGPVAKKIGCQDSVHDSAIAQHQSVLGRELITLNSRLQQVGIIFCRDSNLAGFLIRAILHELGHVVDVLGLGHRIECSHWRSVSGKCSAEKLYKISDSLRFRSLFTSVPLRMRSADVYEGQNTQEYFAVNFEYFLLDHNYKCRLPLMYSFFLDHFGFIPFENVNCTDEVFGYYFKTGVRFNIKPSNIRKISYVYVSPGESKASQFGHGLLVLLFCEGGTQDAIAICEKDDRNKLAVSFLLLDSSEQVSTWKTLTGEYLSTFFFYTLPEMKKEYDEGEQRSLSIINIEMTSKQLEMLVYRIFEKYWTEMNSYHVLYRNCATETLRLLQSILPEQHPIQDESVLTPHDLIGAIQRGLTANLSSESAILNIPSQEAIKLRMILEELSGLLGYTITYVDYKDMKFEEREHLLDRFSYSHRQRAARLLYLLEWRLQNELFTTFLSQSIEQMKNSPEIVPALNRHLQNANNSIGVWSVGIDSKEYGLPMSGEVHDIDLPSRKISQKKQDALVFLAKARLYFEPFVQLQKKFNSLLNHFKKEGL